MAYSTIYHHIIYSAMAMLPAHRCSITSHQQPQHHISNINIDIHSQNDGHAAHTSLHVSTYVKALRSCLCSDSTSYGRPLMLPFRRLFFAFAAFAAFAAAALAERFDNIASVARRLLLPLPRGVAMLPVWCMIWYM